MVQSQQPDGRGFAHSQGCGIPIDSGKGTLHRFREGCRRVEGQLLPQEGLKRRKYDDLRAVMTNLEDWLDAQG